MAISDDERRDVARKLREIERQTLCELTDGELIDFLVETVGFNRYTNEDFDEGLLGRIADLIDRPTCRNIGDDYMFKCSECGAEFEPVTVNGNEYGEVFYTPLKPLYCSACGAEVVG